MWGGKKRCPKSDVFGKGNFASEARSQFVFGLVSTVNFVYSLFFQPISWGLPRGAGSEVWNRVYMIAPVKKFGRMRLSTNFPSKQTWRWMQTWKDDECLLSFQVFPRPNIKERFSWTLLMEFLDISRHDVWTVHGWLHFSWFGISASSVIYKLREFYERPLCSISYIFLLTAVLRLSILNTCYEHTALVWVLQQ